MAASRARSAYGPSDHLAELTARNVSLERRAVRLQAENVRLKARVAELEATVEVLQGKVVTLETERSRHSGNSSKPPSSDTLTQRAAQKALRAERRRVARQEKKRRPGKQPGTEGRHLHRVEWPDHTLVHTPEVCDRCGHDLKDAPVQGTETRQVFDIPLPHVEVTEHVCQRRRCPGCGQSATAVFPPQATAPACWGPKVRALAVYLLCRQHLPVERTAELLEDVLGAPVSTGWLAGLPAEAAHGLGGFLDHVKALLRVAPVVHVDETGANVAGQRWWFHDVSTDLLTLIDCHPKRGVEATDHMDVLPQFGGVAVHDRWKPYWRYTACLHALCGAHLLRDLAAVAELASQKPWAEQMITFLLHAKTRAETAVASSALCLPRAELRRLRARYTKIIKRGLAANPGPLTSDHPLRRQSFNLVRALREHKDEALRFCSDLRVPFDNNQSERDLRMVKLQQKISGCFRTPDGAKAFCAVRSYLQTAAKQQVNLLDALTRLFAGDPWMPAGARAP